MFNKKKQPPIKSLIADGSQITGNITFTDGLRVDGQITGNIHASEEVSSILVISEIATVTVVPASMSAEEVLALSPAGVFLSNGPGDPEMVKGATEAIRTIVEAGTPTFGICLGHQLLSRAFGGHTFKLPFGHHGANHPVRHIATGSVEITSQNHNFCVDPDSLSGVADITHINLNDHTNEGMRLRDLRAFSVQYHPEAGPGPHDSHYLFGQFAELMEKK